MCRNIKTLANFDPGDRRRDSRVGAAIRAQAQWRSHPSRANEVAFNTAVDEVTAVATRLIRSITTSAPPRNREEEARKARERGAKRFASPRPARGVASQLQADVFILTPSIPSS
jgi:hypothetical protein